MAAIQVVSASPMKGVGALFRSRCHANCASNLLHKGEHRQDNPGGESGESRLPVRLDLEGGTDTPSPRGSRPLR